MNSNEIVYNKKEGLNYITFKELEKYEELGLLITERGEDFKCDSNNIDELRKKYDMLLRMFDSERYVVPKQTHTINVKVIEDEEGIWTHGLEEIDAVVTNKRKLLTSLVFADCMPIGIYDPKNHVIANVHSGWKGTLNSILTETLKVMNENFNTKNSDVIVVIGPSIRKCHFEVESDVKDMFYEKYSYLDNINDIITIGRVENGVQKYNIDSALLNKTLMINLGIKEENIIDSNICSVCENDKFYSYRKEKDLAGRHSLIMFLK